MSSNTDVRTVIHSEVEFTARDNYKYVLPLGLQGTDTSLSEISIVLVMARDAAYRMPNDLRLYLWSRSSESQGTALNLTGVLSRHYVHHLRQLFPSQDVLSASLHSWALEFVRYHTDLISDERQTRQLLTALWESLPADDTNPSNPRWEFGNGAKGNRFVNAHWFSLPHAVVPVPPVSLLASEVGDAIRAMEGDLVLEVTSGDPSMTQSERSWLETDQDVRAPKTCGAFTLTVDIARTNPLLDDIAGLTARLEELARHVAQHEQRLNDLQSLIELRNSAGEVTVRMDGNAGDIILQ